MNIQSVVLLAVVAAVAVIAFKVYRRRGGRSCGCGSCHGCDAKGSCGLKG